MIYTVTLNPALDYVIDSQNLIQGQVNRAQNTQYIAGGKGINVSVVLSNLGEENIATGFVGGFVGEKLENMLTLQGIRHDFVRINGESRINVKLRGNDETEINAQGPDITKDELEGLFSRLSGLGKNDYLVLAGSKPQSLDNSVYAQLIKRSGGAEVIVDATGELLKNTLCLRPDVIKPNDIELSELTGLPTETDGEVVTAAKRLIASGARSVLVSRGKKGGVFIREGKEPLFAAAPQGTPINTVGAGDSMLAGFIFARANGFDDKKALLFSVCTGSASAFSSELATKKEIDDLFSQAY